jgi:hypothetical protein
MTPLKGKAANTPDALPEFVSENGAQISWIFINRCILLHAAAAPCCGRYNWERFDQSVEG